MRRNYAILYRGSVDDAVIVVQPGDRIAVLFSREGGFVGGFSSYRNNFRSPAGKGVGVLCRSRLRRIRVRGNSTVLYRGRVNDAVVIVQPGDRVAVLLRRERSLVSGFSGYGNDFRRPACEGVSILCRCCLGCIRMRRNHTVLDRGGVDDAAVFVLPGDRVAVLFCSKGCFVSSFSSYRNDFRSPAGKGVGVLCRCRLRRIGMRRNYAILYRGGVYDAAVFVLPGDGITVLGRRKRGSIGRISSHSNDCRIPARERVSVLSVSSLRGISMRRDYTIFVGFFCALSVDDPGNSELLDPESVIGASHGFPLFVDGYRESVVIRRYLPQLSGSTADVAGNVFTVYTGERAAGDGYDRSPAGVSAVINHERVTRRICTVAVVGVRCRLTVAGNSAAADIKRAGLNVNGS